MDGRSSRTVAAELILQGGEYRLRGESRVLGTVANTRIEPRLSDLPRTIEFPDGARFETDEHAVVDTWLRMHGRTGPFIGALHALEGNGAFVLAMLGLTGALVVWVLWAGIPMAAEIVAHRIDPRTVAGMSGDVLARLDDGVLAPSELPPERRARIRQSLADAAGALPDAPDYDLVFRSGTLNALALPDGTIVVTDELIEFATDDAEVLGVLLHELGHLARRHALRQVLQASAGSMLFVLITGEMSGTTLLSAMPAILAQLHYSRGLEIEADDWALAAMATLDRDPRPLASFLERLAAASQARPPAWLSTHPAPASRAERLRSLAGITDATRDASISPPARGPES